MQKSNARHVLPVLILALSTFSFTCFDDPFEPEPQEAELTISMQVSGAVEAVSVEITAEDITTPIVENIPVSNGVASGTVTVPAGSDRLITVRAFDENAIETHRGSRTVDVVAGENLLVEISLIPLTGEQPIIATAGTYDVTIDPVEVSIDVLESVQLTATITGVNDAVIQNPTLRWGSMNPIIAEVDQNGLVTGGHAGVTTIVVNYLGMAAAAEVVVAGELVQRIAFQGNRDGNREIFVVNADGSGLVNVSNSDAIESNAAWSPDGTKLAFTSDRETPGARSQLFVMNPDGTGVINVSNNNMSNSEPAWSPDGTMIAHNASFQVTREVHVSYADGSGSVNLTVDGNDYGSPTWSPDGGKIAFRAYADGVFDIYTMNSDGTDRFNVTNDDAEEHEPTWSSVGEQIAFYAEAPDGNREIYVINADGSGLTNLTNDPGWDFNPAWSPDGTQIAFSSIRDNAMDIYLMNADGTGLTNLTNQGDWHELPSWSPDGTKIVFVSARDGNYEIYSMNADGTGLVNLSNDPGSDNYPAWGGNLVFPGPGY